MPNLSEMVLAKLRVDSPALWACADSVSKQEALEYGLLLGALSNKFLDAFKDKVRSQVRGAA